MRAGFRLPAAAVSGLASLALALAGCGQGGSSPGTQSAPPSATAPATSQPASPSPSADPSASIAAGHDSPEAAVQGFLAAGMAGHHAEVCAYQAPDLQPACQQAAGPVSQAATSGGFVIRGKMIVGTRALVEVTGNECLPTTGCTGNSDPAHGMPASAAGFARAYDNAVNTGGFSPVPCAEVNGKWYVAN